MIRAVFNEEALATDRVYVVRGPSRSTERQAKNQIMTSPTSVLLILFQLTQRLTFFVSCAQQCKSQTSQYGYALKSSAYTSFTTEDVGMCTEKCIADRQCNSINFNFVSRNCDHNHVTKEGFPSRFVEQENSLYSNIREPEYGTTMQLSVHSCKRIRELNPTASSGVYWIKPGNDVTPFQVFCEMTIDGGGWTLVYSYRFTNFANFIANSNAVTPFPTWSFDNWRAGTWTPRSTVVPLNETALSAMDFGLWRKIGDEFLVKPNITHWIACLKGTGDLLNWKTGTLNCRVIKNVAEVCLNYAPTHFVIHTDCGVALYRNGDYSYFFDGNLGRCYPVHDSCGTRSIHNYLNNVPQPGGAIYVR